MGAVPVLIAPDEMSEPTADPVPTTDGICRAVAEYALRMRPNATACSIVIESEDGDGRTIRDVIAVPLTGRGADDLQSAIVAALQKLRPGEWIRGKSLASEVDSDHTSGHFYRTIAQLRESGRLESNKNLGYRLKQPSL